ncbi:MAG: hypothetical protein QXO62_06700 [Thermoproteota archaeon]
MTVLRASVILAGFLGKFGRAGEDKVYGVIVKRSVPWAKKPITLSNMPFTAIYPHPRQAEVRYEKFPEFVASAKGTRRWESLRGKSYRDKLTLPKLPEDKKAKGTYRTAKDGLKILEKYKATAAAAAPAAPAK